MPSLSTNIKLFIGSILGFVLFGMITTWLAQHVVTPKSDIPKIVVTPRVDSEFFAPYKDSYHLHLCPVVAGNSYCVNYEREGEFRTSLTDEQAREGTLLQ
jgi:hypothetical protein